jgi:hypothetical protein
MRYFAWRQHPREHGQEVAAPALIRAAQAVAGTEYWAVDKQLESRGGRRVGSQRVTFSEALFQLPPSKRSVLVSQHFAFQRIIKQV